jgi:hypothetical protein
VGVGIAVVLLAGVVGFIIGAKGAESTSTIVVFGTIALPASGGAIAAYGVALAAAIVGLLFGAVSVASRYDEHA